MTSPIDFTDPKLVKACAHPLRIRILGMLDGRVASPSEIATEIGTPLSNTSYHVRQLASLGLIELVDRAARRGAIEHYYTAKVRPTITHEGWGNLPPIVRRAMMGAALEQGVAHVVAAAQEGGFDRDDIHYSRTAGRLDDDGWNAVADELAGCLQRIEAIFDETERRLAKTRRGSDDVATVLLMHFSGPSISTAGRMAEESAAATDAASSAAAPV